MGAEEFVHGDRAVLRALLRRRVEGSLPGERADGHRIALVVGGGGMRGAYSGGMVCALEELALREAFDEVYGTSAGCFTAGAFVTGQAAGAALIFHEDLACREFIDVRRAATGRGPLVSMDHVMHVLTAVKPMNWAVYPDSPVPLRVVATRLPELRAHTLTGLPTVAEWQTAMRAGATIPLLGGPPVSFHGARWVDGSVSEPLAVGRALDGGSTHVLTLLCRAASEVRARAANGVLPVWARSLDRVVPGLGTVANGSQRYAESLRMISDAAHPARGGAHLLALSPARPSGVGGLTIDVDRVRAASRVGYDTVRSAFAALGDE